MPTMMIRRYPGGYEEYLRHALVDDGVASSLTDHEIGPLHNDNGHEEGGVTGVLQHLALGIGLQQQHNNSQQHTTTVNNNSQQQSTTKTTVNDTQQQSTTCTWSSIFFN